MSLRGRRARRRRTSSISHDFCSALCRTDDYCGNADDPLPADKMTMTLRRRREKAGLTRSVAAAYAGCTAESIKRWEKGLLPEKSRKFDSYIETLERAEMKFTVTQADDPALHELLEAAQAARAEAATDLPNSPEGAQVVAMFDDAIGELISLMPTHNIRMP